MTIQSIREILESVYYHNWFFFVGQDGDRAYLQVRFNATCSVTGRTESQSGRKWFLSPHMTKSEIVQTALKAVLTAEEHEAREHFTYHGRAIFGAHFDVDALVRLVDAGAVDVRKEAA